jgi:hypothetical protein
MPLIPTLKRLRQEDCKFEASLGYTVSPRTAWAIYSKTLKKKRKKRRRKEGREGRE